MSGEVVGLQCGCWCFWIEFRQCIGVCVIGGSVFSEQLRSAIARVMGVGEPEVDEKWVLIVTGLSSVEVF